MHKVLTYLIKHRLVFLLLLYLLSVGALTLSPFTFSLSYLKELFVSGKDNILLQIFRTWEMKDLLLNILLFMPLGFIIRRIEIEYSIKIKIVIIVLIGCVMSATIEGAQLFLDRNTNISDVVTNTFGTILGYLLTSFLLPWHDQFYMKLKRSRWIRIVFILLYTFAILYILTLGIRLNHLQPWGRKYPFILGNEATKDRPWQGKLFKVAMYNKALKPSQVKRIFNLKNKTYEKADLLDPVLQFDLNEKKGNMAFSDSTLKHTFYLKADSLNWLENGGIVLRNQLIQNDQDISLFYEDLVASGEFSIELWMQTNNFEQYGPARIISSSKNPDRRNFTIGQNGEQLQFRVCTPQTGVNGSWVMLDTKPVLTDCHKHHIVFTFNHGVERFFWDGKSHSKVIRLHLNYLPQYFNFGVSAFSKFVSIFLLFIPYAFLFHGLFKKQRIVKTVMSVVVLILGFEFYLWVVYYQPISLLIIIYVLCISLVGAILGECYHKQNLLSFNSK